MYVTFTPFLEIYPSLSEMTIAEGFQELPCSIEDIACAIVKGINLGLYRFKKHTKEEQKDYRAIQNLTIAVKNQSMINDFNQGVLKGKILSESTNMSRDLVNEPANFMTPEIFAQESIKVAKRNNIKIAILDKEEIKKEKMEALLAVNAGSAEPPRLIVMEYNGVKNGKTLGLVGKGVTFDSGGYSLKPSDSMYRMLAGAAAVLGAMECIAKNKLPINVVAVMPMTDNLVDSNAFKVGDVINTREGKTVEVLNTDAEGRLILADALSYIRSYKKIDYLIDIATLTGSIVIALGHFCSGAMTNNQDFYNIVETAGIKSGEKVWQLPLFEEYKAQIRSEIADLENVGGRAAGSITAAIFLKEFVSDIPWVHIDIAGTAWTDDSIITYMKNPFLPKQGGTVVGTRLMYYVAEMLSRKDEEF